ncbi:hypothetical protein [Nocardioides aequoreus]|uniref:hypothetical protein n=1 Tax=Nocardioides aequoreus TaxID=397278 RepID=UPI0012F6A74E|nr:hypothetical protein [Nocardioides aequoreus]
MTGVGLYTLALVWSVDTLIAPVFGYQGYVDRSWSLFELVGAIVATVVLSLTVDPDGRLPSDVARLFLLLTTAVPVVWIPMLYGTLSTLQVQNLMLTVTASFVLIALALRGGRRRLVVLHVSRTTFWILLSGFGILSVAYLASRGIGLRLSGFADVYAQREQYRTNVDRLGAYLVGWLAGGTFPVLIALGLHLRRLAVTLTGLLGVVLLYSLTGYKSYAIAVAILIGTFVMTRRGHVRTWHWVSLLSGLIVAVGVLDLARSGYGFTSLLVRRALSTAGINTGYYVDLFDGGPYYALRHSVLSFAGPSPYDTPPGLLVGRTYYDAGTAANANFLADGFANAGWIGMLVAALLVALLLRAYDKVSDGLPLCVSAPALVFILLALANTAVLTVVATHGAAVLVGWVSLLPASLAVARRRDQRAGPPS